MRATSRETLVGWELNDPQSFPAAVRWVRSKGHKGSARCFIYDRLHGQRGSLRDVYILYSINTMVNSCAQ